MMTNPMLTGWEQLKLMSFVVDRQVDLRRITAPRISHPDQDGLRTMQPAKTTDVLREFCRLMIDLGLVSRDHDVSLHQQISRHEERTLDLPATLDYLNRIFAADTVVGGLLITKVCDGTIQRLLRHAYALTLTNDGWPRHFPLVGGKRVRVGIVAKSIDGKIEGRTTGGRRKCPSNQCNGWLVGVHWQTGQQLHICTEGWHYDPTADELRVIGGGTISARFVSPKPFGVEPLPRREWPMRADLLRTKAWSISTG